IILIVLLLISFPAY
ncbi:type I toxin-antitoxin system Ibs family toxin, partial [Escherichia coli]|nr:type I toxin-antitoxin system Ibs family toxin [Escherichia coli]